MCDWNVDEGVEFEAAIYFSHMLKKWIAGNAYLCTEYSIFSHWHEYVYCLRNGCPNFNPKYETNDHHSYYECCYNQDAAAMGVSPQDVEAAMNKLK